ncbi:MAG: hypothetical protein HY901_35370, partial [Deltaproteobacteria bacterium]|nr:hypothetical protein [Deltaproteobacteria bacterium]
MRTGKPLTLAACLALALSACPGEKNPPPAPGPDAGCDPADPVCNPPECQTPEDCGDVRLFDCLGNACVAACTTKADCAAHPAHGNGPWPGCENGMCLCDARTCVSSVCSADGECAQGQVCRSGACGSPDIGPDSCEVVPELVVMRKDEAVTFTVTAFKGNAVSLLGPNAFTWTSGDPSVGKVDENGTFKGVAASGGYKDGAVRSTVKALPSVSCSARVMVLDAISEGARVVVVDEITHRLVPDAKVVLNGVTLTEDAAMKGLHTVATVTSATPTVLSVFHHDYGYVSLVGITKTDLLVPLRHNPNATKGGGFKGTFTSFPDSEVSFGLAGVSLAGNFTDVDLNALSSHAQPTELTFNGQTRTADLPSAVMLGMGARHFKEGYQAWGYPGVCPDEAATLAGECGVSAGFGLMGTVPITAATPFLNEVFAGQAIDPSKALAVALPYLKSFKSAIVRDISYKLKTVPADPSILYADAEAFPKKDLNPTIALSLKQTVVVPDLPASKGTQLEGVVVVAGGLVPGRGLIPLGLTAGTDTLADCTTGCAKNGKVVGVDVAEETPLQLAYHDDGKLGLRMAPNHSGIEGSRYGVLTLAMSSAGAMPNGATVSSALVTTLASMPNGTEVSYTSAGFLGFAETGAYDYRSGKFEATTLVSGATFHRAVFTTEAGRHWTVYFNQNAFDLPKPPTGFEDRTMSDGKDRSASPNSARAPIAWWAIKASDQEQGVGIDGLFDFAFGRAMGLSSYVNGFSTYSVTPTVAFVAPSGAECGKTPQVPGSCNVYDGNYTFRVKVSGVEVPAQAKLLFAANTGEKKLVDAVDANWIADCKFRSPLMKDDDLN